MSNMTTHSSDTAQSGSIACVGLGMTLGSHLSPLARSHIEQADVVFAALSDGIVEMWLESCTRTCAACSPTMPRASRD